VEGTLPSFPTIDRNSFFVSSDAYNTGRFTLCILICKIQQTHYYLF
jgi:hypothetical protein